MGRRPLYGYLLNLLILVCGCVFLGLYFYNRLKTAEQDLVDYKLALSCPSRENCREKYEATILEAHSESFSMASKGVRANRVSYYFLVSSEQGDYSFEISANPPSIGTPFDIGNVQVPPETGKKFLDENFSVGETVMIEIWHGRVVFMYVASVVDLPTVNVRPILDSLQPAVPILLSAPPPVHYDIALPTAMHPILLHATADRNFYWVAFYAVLSVLAYSVFLFRKRKSL